MKIPVDLVRGQSDHSLRCGISVCSPSSAQLFALRRVSQQELNLFQFTTCLMAKIVASMAIVLGLGSVLIQQSSSRRVDPTLPS
jgi:hypothetical protein